MRLQECAELVGTDPKWVLNARTALGIRGPYTLDLALRLLIARTVEGAMGIPLSRAGQLAEEAIRQWTGDRGIVTLHGNGDACVALSLDILRMQSVLNTRRSALATTLAPRRAGRPRTVTRDAIASAAAWGIDISLLQTNLHLTPHARLRQLDGMHAFARAAKRVTRGAG